MSEKNAFESFMGAGENRFQAVKRSEVRHQGIDYHVGKKYDDTISRAAGTQLALVAITAASVTKVIRLEGIDGVSVCQIVGQAPFKGLSLRLGDLCQKAFDRLKGFELFCLVGCHQVRSLSVIRDIIDKHLKKYKRFPQRSDP
jgi:hypothetical protein